MRNQPRQSYRVNTMVQLAHALNLVLDVSPGVKMQIQEKWDDFNPTEYSNGSFATHRTAFTLKPHGNYCDLFLRREMFTWGNEATEYAATAVEKMVIYRTDVTDNGGLKWINYNNGRSK